MTTYITDPVRDAVVVGTRLESFRPLDLTPTFGNAMGARLLVVYVREPGAAPVSDQPAFPRRNHPWRTAGRSGSRCRGSPPRCGSTRPGRPAATPPYAPRGPPGRSHRAAPRGRHRADPRGGSGHGAQGDRDVITPPGTSQEAGLDPTRGPVVIASVTVP